MRTYHRRSRLLGFGLIDAVVAILVLSTAAVAFSSVFQTVGKVSSLQQPRIQALLQEADALAIEQNL